MANNNKIIPGCNPPHSCFNCPYPDDCHNTKPRTKSETEFIEIAGLAKGRHGTQYAFPLAKDYVHNRNRRLI